jgi:3-dehydrotetronate 4-kinase
MNLKLGCIADDFTGATDLANNLVRAGMRVVQTIGVPTAGDAVDFAQVDVVVVALKSRTIPAADAVTQSLAALHWLQSLGASQIYFKYCSTFDSLFSDATGPQRGNIGPVTEALMDALHTDFTIATPAFPDNGRTVVKGHLFVGDVLLNESGMQNHPLTPMSDANLVRVMQAQCARKVGLIDYRCVAAGVAAVQARVQELRGQGVGIAIVDALHNEDLMRLGPALLGMPLVTAGSGVAIGLPQNYGIAPSAQAAQLPAAKGLQAVVSGSCSLATNAQVKAWIDSGLPALALDTEALAANTSSAPALVRQALDWATPLLATSPVLVYSSADPQAVKAVQATYGAQATGDVIEHALAQIAAGLVAAGVRQLVVAGGETSGACVQALGVQSMRIGPQIDPGVPWCYAQVPIVGESVHIALKSGNFGSPDFFGKAFKGLQ